MRGWQCVVVVCHSLFLHCSSSGRSRIQIAVTFLIVVVNKYATHSPWNFSTSFLVHHQHTAHTYIYTHLRITISLDAVSNSSYISHSATVPLIKSHPSLTNHLGLWPFSLSPPLHPPRNEITSNSLLSPFRSLSDSIKGLDRNNN